MKKQTIRREQIYQTAARLFFSQGYHATTMRQLAHEVGVEQGSLYNYYQSKQDMLYNIVQKGNQDLTENVEAALKSAVTPSEQMSAALTAHISHFLKRKEEVSIHAEIRNLDPEQQAELLKINQAYVQKFRSILAQGIKEGVFRPCNVRFTVMLLLSVASPVAVWYRPDGSISADQVIEWYVEHAMHSLRVDH